MVHLFLSNAAYITGKKYLSVHYIDVVSPFVFLDEAEFLEESLSLFDYIKGM
jgi:hypothetical protein